MNIGTVRIEQQLKSILGSADYLNQFVTENIRAARETLEVELKLDRVKNFVAVGGDARHAAKRVGRKVNERYWLVGRDDFDRFVEKLKGMSVDECVRQFQIPYNEAESIGPALLIYQQFLSKTTASTLVVPDVSIREGVLLSLATDPDPTVQQEFHSQVLASAVSLGRKYHFDESHARHVAFLALSLFDQLRDEHGLDEFSRLLLEVAAMVHDIGSYVSTTGHHKHGQYLVSNAEIFGLHRDDVKIISNVVRYHRKSLPTPSHISYISLPREKRMQVSKLAALLRTADALDKGHRQRIEHITLEKRGDELVINNSHRGDISIERFGLARKANMMEEVFGLKVVLP